MRWAKIESFHDERGHIWRMELWRELERTRRQIDTMLDWWNDQGRAPDLRPLFLPRMSRKLAALKAQVAQMESEAAG